MTHHLVAYPPRAITSQRYLSSGGDSLVIWFAPFAIVYVLLVLLVGLPAIPILAGGGIVALLNSALHDMMHVEGSLISRIMPAATARHRWHHRRMRRNFGILSSAWDRLFGTLLVSNASRSRHRP